MGSMVSNVITIMRINIQSLKILKSKGNKFLDKFLLENNLLKTSGGDFHGNVGQPGMDIDQKDWDLFYSKLLSL